MAHGFTVLHESEVLDFNSSIKQLGFVEGDFDFSQTSTPLSSGLFHTITGTVTVRRKSTGVQKSYSAGHGSSWPVSFHDDLANDVFGAP